MPEAPSSAIPTPSAAPPKPVPLAFDPARTLAVIHAWPDGRADGKLIGFLLEQARVPLGQLVYTNKRYIPAAYNSAVRDALLSPFEHFIFADHDVRPGRLALPFLDAAGDVVCCPCNLENNVAWADPMAFHCGLWRTSRLALLKLAPPWFLEEYSPDGCELVKCVCRYFAEKARAAGLSVTRAGWAEHPTHR